LEQKRNHFDWLMKSLDDDLFCPTFILLFNDTWYIKLS
jgi:hypothetical protein